jgi:SAM-dependent methyltransferase
LSKDPLDPSRRVGWPGVDFRAGHADTLPLGDGEAGAYRADKVYHALPDPARALAEARRVLTPGGRIVLLGQDWDALVIESDDPALTRAVVHARADMVPHPRAARGYRNLLLDTGFTEVKVEVHTGIFTDTTMLPMLTGFAAAAKLHRDDHPMAAIHRPYGACERRTWDCPSLTPAASNLA